MELVFDHAIGFSTLRGGLHCHPNGVEYLHAAGASLVICNVAKSRGQHILCGHSGVISAMCLSKSGALIASGERGSSSDVLIWKYESLSIVHRLAEHDHEVTAIAFSDDEELLCTVGGIEDGKLVIWDTSTAEIVTMALLEPLPCMCAAWCGTKLDAKRRLTTEYQLCTASGSTACIWSIDPYAGKLQRERVVMDGRGSIVRHLSCIAFAPLTGMVLGTTTTGDIMSINLKTKTAVASSVIASGSGSRLEAIALSQQGLVYVGARNGTITALDCKLREIAVNKLPAAVVALSLVPGIEDELLVGTSTGLIYRLQTQLSFSKCLLVSESHAGAVRSLSFASGTAVFATSSLDRTLRVWDIADYKTSAVATVQRSGEPLCLILTLDFIVSGWTDGIIRMHDTCSGEPLWQIGHAHPHGGVASLLLAHSQRFVVSGGVLGEVRVWELRSRKLVSHLKEHSAPVTGLALRADDHTLLTCSKDRSFLCWDLLEERRISSHVQRMGGINKIALSKDERFVFVVGQERRLTKWDLREQNASCQANLSHDGLDEASAIALSHCGHFIATGGKSREVKLWNAADVSLVAKVTGHSDVINDLAFSPCDEQLISVGEDGSILVW
eukprot:CAMPEP_0197401052 /NCGR_PEP_ID=MMETSP1165-20131217/17838_1 /TAXON_ID=284809 /ORGANISM="Chrysocystis fragilis, Strain CCMP3189" /LENGTH=612 /DNA_ID=CAMNT_0042927151 /DNA_START=529 /DNA_END=2364 /DNA_ORIENTATION=-